MTEDPSRRSVELDVELPATPEEVWDAIATGPGISSWFVPTELEPRPGGEALFHFGPGLDAPATVTAYDAPRRLAYEEPWEGATLATEFLVEARAGGTCVVRVVSTFSADGFGDALDDMAAGWLGHFGRLRVVLTHFRGLPAGASGAGAVSDLPVAETWARLAAGLGLDGTPAGARVEAPGTPVAGMAAVVEAAGPQDVLLRTDAPVTGLTAVAVFSWEGVTRATVHVSFFGDDAGSAVAREAGRWQRWLEERLPAQPGERAAGAAEPGATIPAS